MHSTLRILLVAAFGALSTACAAPAEIAQAPQRAEARQSFVIPPPRKGFDDDLVLRDYPGARTGRRSFGEMRDPENCPKPETLKTMEAILAADEMGCSSAALAAIDRYMAELR